MTGTYQFVLWLVLGVWLMGSGISSLQAQDAAPIILVIDSSEEVNTRVRQADLYTAIEKVVFFIAASNPVSLVTTCSPATGSQSPTQDVAILRATLDQIKLDLCSPINQPQALQPLSHSLATKQGM